MGAPDPAPAPMTGRRLQDGPVKGVFFAEGDYLYDPMTGRWWVRPPGGHLSDLNPEEFGSAIVVEADGTLTLTCSLHDPDNCWHGYLERGQWRRVA